MAAETLCNKANKPIHLIENTAAFKIRFRILLDKSESGARWRDKWWDKNGKTDSAQSEYRERVGDARVGRWPLLAGRANKFGVLDFEDSRFRPPA